MINRSKPNAKVQGTQGPMNAQAYLKQLEDLLKRNTGTGLFVGQDTSSNSPMYIPGKVSNPTGLGETASTMVYGNGMTQPTPVQRNAPETYPEPNQVDVPEAPISIEDFLSQVEQSYNAPDEFGNPQLEGVMSTADGGTMLGDGTIVYDDGTIRMGDPNAFAIASMEDGSILYSDNNVRRKAPEGIASLAGDRESIRYSDGSSRWGQYQYGQDPSQLSGVEGLSQALFGRNQAVTQPYMNYNPTLEPGSGYNTGIDFRTKDLTGSQRELKLPFGATVVEVYGQAKPGSGYAGNYENQGWGNSVVLKLDNGELLRVSHLDYVADIQPGQRIEAGVVFGQPGSTGNVTGEHSDVMYFDAQGNRKDPNQFSAEGLKTPLPNQPAPGTLVNPPQQSQEPQVSQKPIQQDGGSQPEYKPFQTIQQAGQEAGQNVANVFNQAKEAVQPMSPQREKLGSGINTLGEKAGLPEMFAGEVVSGQVTPGQALSYNIENANLTPRIDTGLSEFARGDFKGGLANLKDTASRIGSRISRIPGEVANEVVKPAYADDGSQKPFIESLGQNLKGAADSIGDYASAKAGEGIKALGQAGVSALENVFKPQPTIAKRAVGDVSGTAEPTQAGQFSSLMDGAPSMMSQGKNDVADPFFKLGGAEMYKQFLKPNAKDLAGGALTMDLFNEDFYKDLGNISSVFGGSKDLGSATEKYVDFEKTKYQPMSKMGYSDEYDSGSIDAYNRQVDEYNNSLNNYFNEIRSSTKGQQSIFTPLPTSANKNIFASGSPSRVSSPVMSSANFSLAAPSTAAPSASLVKSAQKFSAPSASVSAPRQSSPIQSFAAVNKAVASAPKAVQASVSKQIVAAKPSNQAKTVTLPNKAVVNFSAPTSASSAQLKSQPAPQSKPKSNVFSKVINTIKNVFRR